MKEFGASAKLYGANRGQWLNDMYSIGMLVHYVHCK